MRRLAWTCALALTLAGCATGTMTTRAPGPKAAHGAEMTPEEALAAQREVAATLRDIEARVRKAEGGQLRQMFTERIARHADDLFAKLYLAWIDAPSEDAGTQINALAKINPEEPWLRTALARIYLSWKGFAPQARKEIDQVLSRHPDFLPALTVRADIDRVEGKLDAAIAAYRAIIARDAQCYEAHMGLSLALEAKGDVGGARSALEAAIAIDARDPVTLHKMAGLLTAQGQNKSVIGIYEKLLDLNPGDTAIRRKLADLRLVEGDAGGAAADFEIIQEREPTVEVARRLVELYAGLKRTQDELRALEALVRIDEAAGVDIYRRLYELRFMDGDADGAEAALRMAVERAPDDLTLRVLLAKSIGERGTLIQAIEAHRQAVERGARELKGPLKALEARASLPAQPLRGNVSRLYNLVHLHLKKALTRRQKDQPWLGGTIGARVTIVEGGKVGEVQITQNTLQDPELTALVYFSFLDAHLPGERARSVSFEFVLMPLEEASR